MPYKHEDVDEPARSGGVRIFTQPLRLMFAFGVALIVGALSVVGIQSLVRKMSPVSLVSSYFIPKPQTYFHKDRIAVLVLGIDYNYDSKDQEYSAGARSDTIMAVALNLPSDANAKPSINVLSVLRDTYVDLPNGRSDKINTAFADGGAKFAEKAVAQFLGIPGFDRYVTLRVDATKQLVDAIGGIDVVPDETMNYDDSWGHLHIHFVAGKHYHMNGEQAVSYSRFRHDWCGDPCRVKRQQQVMRIMIAKLRNDKLNDLLHIRQLIGVANRNVTTDLHPEEELSLASAFAGLDLHDVKTDQVPFTGDRDLACCGDVIIADDVAKAKLVHKLFLEQATTAAPADPAAVAAIPAKSITVEVLNGSGTPGLGRRAADALRAKGFTIGRVGNADAFSYDTTVIQAHSATQPLAGERVRQALPKLSSATVSADSPAPGGSADVTVIVGRDYAQTDQREASTTK
jgi:polyisoprenyl-teichoic acid--peptidoglycan teichoic acid transferase